MRDLTRIGHRLARSGLRRDGPASLETLRLRRLRDEDGPRADAAAAPGAVRGALAALLLARAAVGATVGVAGELDPRGLNERQGEKDETEEAEAAE